VTDLREQLQASLGSAYSLDQELGGGGMSRVFAATETALGRKVVVKVLAPELALDVNTERFRREIQLAAQLQQANIVPLLTAGEISGLPYYTMPLVDGRSLRSRLGQGGTLPITEAVSVLRDVAKALSYAHEHGVVHRDIKPDNVLLSGGTAVVTDFGVAKALSAAKRDGAETGGALTAVGSSLGTPAYMAPEQVAADPSTDQRADIYAFGVMAYELLSGHPPFHGRSPQKLLAAQMSEMPEPIASVRADTPPALAELVTKCLQKDPAARPQSAADLVHVLDAVTSGAGLPVMPEILLGGKRRLGRALLLYALSFVAVAIVARAAIVAIGLPDWVFPGALIVMGLGLPVILFTAFVHRGAYKAITQEALTPGGSPTGASTWTKIAVRASPWVSWRRTAMGGVIALTTFAVLVLGWMILRALGIGPAGSLIAAGKINEREPLLLTDFASPSSDTSLGAVVTEAIRTDLAESRAVTVVQPARVKSVLSRMEVPGSPKLDLPLAREVAARDGIRAIVDGDVASLGPTYVLSARLVTADSGTVLAAVRATADGPKELVKAVDQLSRKLRERLGESLRSVHSTPPLEQVTTASLAALRAYTDGKYALEYEGDVTRGIDRLQEAVTIDTAFAMAYRKLASAYNQVGDVTKTAEAAERAFAHRDRLSSVERNITIGSYYYWGPAFDARKSLAAFDAASSEDPTETISLDNAFDMALYLNDIGRAAEYSRREFALDSESWNVQIGMLMVLADRHDTTGMRAIPRAAERAGEGSQEPMIKAFIAWHAGQFDSVATILSAANAKYPSRRSVQSYANYTLSLLAQLRGQLREADRRSKEAATADSSLGLAAGSLDADLESIGRQIWYLDRKEQGSRMLDSALQRHPLTSIPPFDRPYTTVAQLYAMAGRPDRARATMAANDSVLSGRNLVMLDWNRRMALGEIAIAERHFDAAITQFGGANETFCHICTLPRLARAYDLAGNADSSIAIYERYLRSSRFVPDGIRSDAWYLAGIHKRLGELYDARHDPQRAAEHYARFVELWKDADPELQPKVAQVKQRLAHLKDLERK